MIDGSYFGGGMVNANELLPYSLSSLRGLGVIRNAILFLFYTFTGVAFLLFSLHVRRMFIFRRNGSSWCFVKVAY